MPSQKKYTTEVVEYIYRIKYGKPTKPDYGIGLGFLPAYRHLTEMSNRIYWYDFNLAIYEILRKGIVEWTTE